MMITYLMLLKFMILLGLKHWLDSIDQAACISKQEPGERIDEEIRWCCSSNTMMGEHWSDDDVIAKLCQDFSSLSTMNRARDKLRSLVQQPGQTYCCIHLQLWADALSTYRY